MGAAMLTDRFWSKVDRSGDCWEWTAGKVSSGYGVFWVSRERKSVRATRHMAAACMGVPELPSDILVCHHCDNPGCVNPEHLFLGSYEDNAKDRESKSRGNHFCGGGHHFAKLTEDDVAEIRACSGFFSNVQLAKEYGVSDAQISRILSYKTWRHLD